MECTVTRLASTVMEGNTLTMIDEHGRQVKTQCFYVPFTILDTNECTLPPDHLMHHHCPPPSICVNTVGSYECVCPTVDDNIQREASLSLTTNMAVAEPSFWTTIETQERTDWERSFNSDSQTSCPHRPSTYGCCPEMAHTAEGRACRKRFHCPVDPCSNPQYNDCANNAICQRASHPLIHPPYQCTCPNGLMGHGHACQPTDPKPQPKVMFDGVTPTEETIQNLLYCGCHRPIVDACSGFPPCTGT